MKRPENNHMNVGIIGSAGYVAGELIRLLIHHPKINLTSVVSQSQKGKPLTSVHKDLKGESDLVFSETLSEDIDLIFLCSGHGKSKEIMAQSPAIINKSIIDLSTDFRPRNNDLGFIYGLPELNKNNISTAHKIANPGCFATAIQLGLLPLAADNLITSDIHIQAITGSTGAGQKLQSSTHFSWRTNNISIYKLFKHQHLNEIKETLCQLQSNFHTDILFVPIRGNFTRGIFASMYTKTDKSEAYLTSLYQDYFSDHPLTVICADDISLKEVINTNKCFIQVRKSHDHVHITSCIDNLLKGAAGQAVHNMNIMMQWPENMGLQLKATSF